MTPASPQLSLRLAALGLVLVVVQEAAVSQVSILGTSADLVPLLVVSVGLLAGSMPGAVAGFAIGLLVDLLLAQTLGVSALLYILIGYWAGRVRELRDPHHALVPVAAGAAATAVATVGFSLIQFLLGVDSPVSLLLLREIVATILINTLLALPVYALVRRVLGKTLPEGTQRPGRRVRRPLTARRLAGGAAGPAFGPLTTSRRPSGRRSLVPGRSRSR